MDDQKTHEERIDGAIEAAEDRVRRVLDEGVSALRALGGKDYRKEVMLREETFARETATFGGVVTRVTYVRCAVGGVHIDTDDCAVSVDTVKTPEDADRCFADAHALVRRIREAVARNAARADVIVRQFDASAQDGPKVGGSADANASV